MDLDDEHREALAGMFRLLRRRRFGDNKKAAYTAAGVNSATWDRLEAGLRVKGPTLSKALNNLLPETDGDWNAIGFERVTETEAAELMKNGPSLTVAIPPPTVGGDPKDDEQFVESLVGERVASGVSNEDLLQEILRSRAESDRLQDRVESVAREVSSVVGEYRQGIANVRENIAIVSARLARLEESRSEPMGRP